MYREIFELKKNNVVVAVVPKSLVIMYDRTQARIGIEHIDFTSRLLRRIEAETRVTITGESDLDLVNEFYRSKGFESVSDFVAFFVLNYASDDIKICRNCGCYVPNDGFCTACCYRVMGENWGCKDWESKGV